MNTPLSDVERSNLSRSLDRIVYSGRALLAALPDGLEQRRLALRSFSASIDRLSEVLPLVYARESGADSVYIEAAVQIQAGTLLVAGGHAVETGNGDHFSRVLEGLQVQQEELNSGEIKALFYDDELLQPPPLATSAEEALRRFKRRASCTLDNMVTEARDVILDGIEKIGKAFHSFADQLAHLAESFVSTNVMPIIRIGLERIVAGLKMLAEFFKGRDLQKSLDAVKAMLDSDTDLSPKELISPVLSLAFGCNATKREILALELGDSLSKQDLEGAEIRMAELSLQYVWLLKQARWLMMGISVAGAFLVLTGVGAHYSAIGTPVAYATVTVGTLIVGTEFAQARMRALLEPMQP